MPTTRLAASGRRRRVAVALLLCLAAPLTALLRNEQPRRARLLQVFTLPRAQQRRHLERLVALAEKPLAAEARKVADGRLFRVVTDHPGQDFAAAVAGNLDVTFAVLAELLHDSVPLQPPDFTVVVYVYSRREEYLELMSLADGIEESAGYWMLVHFLQHGDEDVEHLDGLGAPLEAGQRRAEVQPGAGVIGLDGLRARGLVDLCVLGHGAGGGVASECPLCPTLHRLGRSYTADVGPPAVRPSLTTVAIAALAVGVVVLCVWQAATLAAPPQSNVRFHDGGIHVFAVAAGDLLDVAGVRPGDVIVAVDGAAVGSGLEFLDRLRAARPGAALRLSLQRAGHRLELTAIAQPGPDLRRLAPALLPVLGLLVAGVGVALTRPPSKATVLFLLLCASAALNTACQLTVVAGTAWPQRVITAAYTLVSLQSPAILLHLFVVFPERLRAQRWLSWWLPVAYGVQTCLGLSYYLPSWLPASTEALRDPQLHRFLFSAFGANAVICPALAAVSLAWQARQGASDRIRQQARLLFFGLALMTVLQLALQEIPVRLSGRTLASPSVLALLDLLLPLVVVVAILRHRLFGIDLLVRRGLILGTASAAAAAALAATFGVLWWAAQRLGERPGTVVAVAAVAAGAVAFPVLRRRSQDWVDRALYHRRYSYRRLLDEISEQLARPFDAAGVALLLEARLADALEPEQVDLVLWRDPPGELQQVAGDGCVAALAGGAAARDLADELARARAPFTTGPGAAGWPPGAALVVPLCRGEVVVGALVLGPRRQELPYVAEDLEFLAALARLTAPVLENARLLEERAAKERLVLLGTATAAVVHELKNPLAAIRSTTAILRRRLREDDRGRELAGVVEEEVERLEGTLLEVLGYARPAASTPAPVLVGDVVRQLATVVEPDLRRSGVELVMTVHDGVGVVRSDPERLRRALLNLLLNARDAMPQGGTVEVVVAPWRQDGGPPRGSEITVSDSGSGFSPEALTRACEPFYSSKRLGTGLGLANVRRTVEESGGEVMLANRPSGGATVVLRLPAAIPGGEG